MSSQSSLPGIAHMHSLASNIKNLWLMLGGIMILVSYFQWPLQLLLLCARGLSSC